MNACAGTVARCMPPALTASVPGTGCARIPQSVPGQKRPATGLLRAGFTLVELLVTISIIGILASLVLVGLAGVQETSRADRTRAMIARLDALVGERWEAFKSRRVFVPMVKPPNMTPQQWRQSQSLLMAQYRLDATRELMRMELPDRKSDLLAPPVRLPAPPTLWRAYRSAIRRQLLKNKNRALPPENQPSFDQEVAREEVWSQQYESAECLYLILSQMVDDERSALEFFAENEVGDVDQDGMLEVLDGWGSPIAFLRWAPGFELVGGPQDGDAPDPFDPRGIYRARGTFALYPLIFSAGPNKQFEILVRNPYAAAPLVYSQLVPPNNPFIGLPGYQGILSLPLGIWEDSNNDLKNGSLDNITNHGLAGGS